MIVHKTETHQMTVEFKLSHNALQQWTRFHTITEDVRGAEIQNVKLYLKQDNRPNLLQNGEQITLND